MDFYCVEEELIYYESYSHGETENKTLPLELLFLNTKERLEYSNNYHSGKAERFRRAKSEKARLKRERDRKIKKERYESYQELKEEFGNA
jgi:hypothetical protein